MCILLVIVNIPLFLMYSSTAGEDANFFNTESLFKHFSIGNIGSDKDVCQVSYLNHDKGKEMFPYLTDIKLNDEFLPSGPPAIMNFKCHEPNAYIYKIETWGFLYKLDIPLGKFSSGMDTCHLIDS
jgi:hypothetical protein